MQVAPDLPRRVAHIRRRKLLCDWKTHNGSSNAGYYERLKSPGVSGADLAMARRHVDNADRRIANHRKFVAILAASRQPLAQAREVLSLLEKTLQTQWDHLAELDQALTQYSPPPRVAQMHSIHREAAERSTSRD